MRSALSSLLLLISFLILPLLIVNFEHGSTEFSLEESLAERGISILADMRRSGTFEMQFKRLFNRFAKGLPDTGTDDRRVEISAKRAHKTMERLLPSHDIYFVRITGSSTIPLFVTTGANIIPGSDALAFATKLAQLTLPGSHTADGLRPIQIDHESRDLEKRLSDELGFPISLDYQSSETQGRVQFFSTLTGQTALFWKNMDFVPGSGSRLLMIVLRLEHMMVSVPERIMTKSWNDRRTGIGFIPLSRGYHCFLSPYFRKHPDIERRLIDIARNPHELPPVLEYPRFLLMSGRPSFGSNFQPIVILPRPTHKMLKTKTAVAGFAASLWLFSAALFLLIEKRVFGRGPRLPLAASLILILLLTALMPMTVARTIVRSASAESNRQVCEETARKLHESLARIDDASRFLHSRIFFQTIQVTKEPNVVKSLEAKLQASLHPASFSDNDILRVLADRVIEDLRRGLPRNLAPGIADMSVVGPNEFKRFLLRVSLDPNTPMKEASDTVFDMFFRPVRAPLIGRYDDTSKWEDTSLGAGTKGLVSGAKESAFISMLVILAGPESLLELMSFPERLNSFLFHSNRLFFTQRFVFVAGRPRFLFGWLWDELSTSLPYLIQIMKPEPIIDPGGASLHLYAVIRSQLGDEESLPSGLAFPSSGRKLATEVPGLLAEILDSSCDSDEPIRSREYGQNGRLVEAFPGRYLSRYMLAGTATTDHLSEEANRRDRRFTVIMIGTLLLACLTVYLLVKSFLAPLRLLQKGMTYVQSGEFMMIPLDESHRDEFGTLARAFNRMTRGLADGRLLGRYVSGAVRRTIRDEQFSATARQGEFREVTVLFSSISNFAEIQERNGSIGAFRSMEAHLEAFNNAIGQHDVDIDKVMGEKILITFDHERLGGKEAAIRTALTVISDVRKALAQGAEPLSIAIGLNTGMVIAGLLGAQTVHMDYTVIGDPVNLAARLAALALNTDGSRIVVAGSVLAAFHSDTRPRAIRLSVTRVKGKTQEVEAFLLLDYV
ncbi:MAG: HAMP domain-containing protein [Candidatus Riflebacteria bacterium]|nr:HAMP domain-containing protein [Candidatus Riflebacteria bacterium]